MQLKLIIGNKNYSSWSLRSWLLLKEAGIEFEEYRIALDVPDSAAEIARFSPSGRVPVLMLGEQPVWDTHFRHCVKQCL
jgi:glutathione S-transferase